MFDFWREATAALVPGFLCQSGRRRPENVSILSSAQTAFLLVGFVCANDKSCSSLVQFAKFIFEVVWSSSYKRDCYVSV